jgi:hypothetical protein
MPRFRRVDPAATIAAVPLTRPGSRRDSPGPASRADAVLASRTATRAKQPRLGRIAIRSTTATAPPGHEVGPHRIPFYVLCQVVYRFATAGTGGPRFVESLSLSHQQWNSPARQPHPWTDTQTIDVPDRPLPFETCCPSGVPWPNQGKKSARSARWPAPEGRPGERHKSPKSHATWNWCSTRSSQRPRRSRQKRIGPASCSWYSNRNSSKTQQRTRPAGFLLSVFFAANQAERSLCAPRSHVFARPSRQTPHGGGSTGLFPSKISTAARPVPQNPSPQNPSGHPHSPSRR